MAGDDLFKRYLEIGASVLGMTRERAESIVRDLVASGEVAKGQATKAADWLVERGRTGSEEMAEMVRREIRQQVAALGLATKDDVARLDAEIAELRASASAPAPAAKPRTRTAKTSAEATTSGTTTSATPRKRSGGADPSKG
jgi:polyhydroxyalkanoate synthesis regulator phasin